MDPQTPSPHIAPLILLIDDEDSSSSSIEGILRPKGHVVLRANSGDQAVDLVGKVSPDALLIDLDLPDTGAAMLIRRLRQSPSVQATTPILVLASTSVGRATRLDLLGAGAWDVLTHPVDANELVLRLDTFVRVKQGADGSRDAGFLDPKTALYNVRGILQRARELSADAHRSRRPLTFVAFGPVPENSPDVRSVDAEAAEAVAARLAQALKKVTRTSDTLGRLGPGEFVVIAPGTDEEGGLRLADRVLDAVRPNETLPVDEVPQVRAGLCAVDGADSTTPEDLLLRASMALRRAQGEPGSFRVRSYNA